MGLCRNIITFLTFQPRDVPFCIHRPLRMRGFRIGGGEFRFFLPKSPQNFDPSDKFFKGAHRERTLWISFFIERRHKLEGSDSGHLPGGGGANKKWNVPYMHHSWLLAGSGRVFSGSGIWPKEYCRIREKSNFFDEVRDLNLTRAVGFAKLLAWDPDPVVVLVVDGRFFTSLRR